MNIQDLRYVVTVAKLRHFGRAAKACHISQPTLSNQIRKLEEELGVVIFERSNKRVDLTEIGEQMVLSAQRAIDEVSELERLATVSRDPLDGPLRLGTIPTAEAHPLGRRYPSIARKSTRSRPRCGTCRN
jgi:LysR family hydrogen peroxide-inducible transcriptional activator